MKYAIKLAYPYERINEQTKKLDEVWRVMQVDQSTGYVPGQYLDKKEVDDLCYSPKWAVTSVLRRDTK
jgi:hypothetical protein